MAVGFLRVSMIPKISVLAVLTIAICIDKKIKKKRENSNKK
jgi:hypothetical protein